MGNILVTIRKYRKIPKNLDASELNVFYPKLVRGRVIKVYDGDTITVASRIPIIGNEIFKFSLRLNRLDTPELRTNNLVEKEYSNKIRDKLSEKIMNKMIEIKVVKTDKYGRYLCEIRYKKENINDWLLDNKYAVKYDGKKKREFDIRDYNEELQESIAVAISVVPEIPRRKTRSDGIYYIE